MNIIFNKFSKTNESKLEKQLSVFYACKKLASEYKILYWEQFISLLISRWLFPCALIITVFNLFSI